MAQVKRYSLVGFTLSVELVMVESMTVLMNMDL